MERMIQWHEWMAARAARERRERRARALARLAEDFAAGMLVGGVLLAVFLLWAW